MVDFPENRKHQPESIVQHPAVGEETKSFYYSLKDHTADFCEGFFLFVFYQSSDQPDQFNASLTQMLLVSVCLLD